LNIILKASKSGEMTRKSRINFNMTRIIQKRINMKYLLAKIGNKKTVLGIVSLIYLGVEIPENQRDYFSGDLL